MWEAVDLDELRVFLTLCDELHFGRTAERLRLSSSRVSQLVRALETKLGVRLVHRTSRRVELTADGERFRADVAVAYGQLIDVLRRTEAAHRPLQGTLRVRTFSGPSAGPHLLDVVAAFEAAHPSCRVEVQQLQQHDMFGALRRGDVDAITSWLPVEEPDVVVGPVLTVEPRVLAVARDHPLASEETVSVEQLADHRVPRFAALPKAVREAWIPARTPSGRPIPYTLVDLPDRNLADLTTRIVRGELVHPTVRGVVRHLGSGIVYVPFSDLPPSRSALIWRRPATDAKLRAFIEVARDALRRASGATAAAAAPV